jgi:zinc protease
MTTRPRRALAAALLALLLPVAATATPAAPQKITEVEGIKEYRLGNGLSVLLFPDPSKTTVTVNITYLVGSRHEGYGESGMAHLLEHLLFKGSTNHPNIPQELTAHGARPNGTTWYDRTNYFETMESTDENLQWALSLESDRMVNSFLRAEDLASEFSVVRNEFEAGENNPRFVLLERVMSAAYLWHNYGKSTIGSRADIERVPIENLRAFYRKWYRPESAILIVAGRFDEAKTLGWIVEKFGPLENPAEPLPDTWTVEPPQDGPREVTLRRVGAVQALWGGWHVPAGSHAEAAAVDVLAEVLGNVPSGRLHRALVETGKATATAAFGFLFREPGMLLAYAETSRDADLPALEREFLATIEGAVATGLTDEEVERARRTLLREWETSFRDSQRLALELSEWSAKGDWRLFFLHRDRLEKVTTADVDRAARSYLVENNRTLGRFLPTEAAQRVEVPATPDVAALVAGYEGREALAQGEEFDPSPEAIEARLVRAALPEGMKLALLPKKTRGETVAVALRLDLGSLETLRGTGLTGSLTAAMLDRGTARKSRAEIRDALDRMKAELRIGGGATAMTANLSVTREHLAEALRLLAELVREPAFPETELDILRRERIVTLEENAKEPTFVASVALDRHLDRYPADDPRYRRTPEEDLALLRTARVDDLRRFHADFYGAAAGELALVGDFDAAEVEALARELFADFRPARSWERIVSTAEPRPAILERLETPDKENAFLIAGLPLALSEAHPDYPALTLGNFVLGGGFLNSRIATRLRQKDGLSYGAGSWLAADGLDDNGIFGGYAIYAPQNVERVIAGFREEIARLLAEGFETQEFDEAKQGLLRRRQLARGQDRELAGLLVKRELEGRTLAFERALDDAIAALDAEATLAALRRWLDPERTSIVVAGDFANKGAAGSE